MSLLTCSEPIGSLVAYDPSFKVEHSLEEPLQIGDVDVNGITLSIVAMASQLDMLCHKELLQRKSEKIEHGQYSNSFESKAMVLHRNMLAYYDRLAFFKVPFQEFVKSVGILKLYPRAAAYILSPSLPTVPHTTTTMDGYFASVAQLHQLLCLSQQLQQDITSLSNHKYLAHQLAVLFQLLNNMNSHEAFVRLKQEIETNFREVKDAIRVTEDNPEPTLPDDYAEWLHGLTQTICDTVSSLPPELTNAWLLPAAVTANFHYSH